jgi:hypothetical protein
MGVLEDEGQFMIPCFEVYFLQVEDLKFRSVFDLDEEGF